MWRFSLVLVGCTATLDMPDLRIEPATIDLDVDLAQPAPAVALHVVAAGGDVTTLATFTITGAPLGAIADGTLTSDGRTGGVATITATIDGHTVSATATANVHGRRLVTGAPAMAPDWFALASDTAVQMPLEPGDGAMLPPNLGKLEVDFGADDGDDVHEIAVAAPYLDLRVYAAGAPGPRHVELTRDEWTAIARTADGEFDLDVRSLHGGGGSPAHAITAHLAIAEQPVNTMIFSGSPADAAGTTTMPQLYRYDAQAAQIEPFLTGPNGGCIGCHVSISADGTKIAAGGTSAAGASLSGVIIDTQTKAITFGDPATPWSTSAFDPSGALVTSYQAQGTLVLRDGTVPRVTLALGENAAAPAISPDGGSLAYVVNDPSTLSFIGTALHVRPWDAATGTVGAVRELATAAGVMAPQFSPDGTWISYSRTAGPIGAATLGVDVVRADGSAPPIELLAIGGDDGIPRFASPVVTTKSGGHMMWISMASRRPLGAQHMIGKQQGLWLFAFDPDHGTASRPIHLPGQTLAISALHAPIALP